MISETKNEVLEKQEQELMEKLEPDPKGDNEEDVDSFEEKSDGSQGHNNSQEENKTHSEMSQGGATDGTK